MPQDEIQILWAELASGEEQAFSKLYTKLYPQLYRYGLKLVRNEELVKDVIQDTFFHLFEKREILSTSIDNISHYLITILRRSLLRKSQQRKKEQTRHEEQVNLFQPSFTLSADDILIREESGNYNKQLVIALLDSLPPRQREILYLKYYQGHNLSEIAETLSISYQTVANQLYRALKTLRGNQQVSGLIRGA